MPQGNTNQTSNDVLHVRILAAAVLTANIVKPGNFVHQIVDDGDDDGDGNGVDPDHHSGNNASTTIGFKVGAVAGVRVIVVAREPAEDAEESR